MQSPPVTPKRKRRGSSGDAVQPASASESARKRAKANPQTPSKSALAKAEARKKKEWKAGWDEYVRASFWEKDGSYRQKVNTFEIHRSDAMKFYRLKAAEMDTLPHWEFENKNYPSHPGRSYSHEGVLMLASRKHAMLAGLHERGLREHELLKQGKKLFDEEQERLLQRTPNKNREPRLFKISKRRPRRELMGFPDDTPSGSWESPIWEDGEIIGHWLNYQFDPNLGPEDDWMFSTARFRPLGSSEWVEPP
ncbi:hypothetical protein KVR01_002858 [Diaporthe batatas]|uniref:uncharacterized protein n=1 Tax=Diaporthe batatas TaxID=748121 RepID=UPI001D03C30A|nr:uncharacterized protein KVR01_002858 [Diaporthe batatas]KAG8167169.1 hypothetical protein KVR01_002858 [Diaporthe batatas]